MELWLELRLPQEPARLQILRQHLSGLPSALGRVDVAQLARETEEFTGADLKRLVEDGKALLAYDRVRRLPPRPVTEYFQEAVQTVRENKRCYAEAETRSRERVGRRGC